MRTEKKVSILGFGFSGLSAAWAFAREGHEVHVYEKSDKIGGLLNTYKTDFGLVETAANAILKSKSVDEMAKDFGIRWAERKKTIKNKWVFVDQPRRWPLSFKETFRNLIPLYQLARSNPKLNPQQGMTVTEWGQRHFKGEGFIEHLLGPALQGIYAQGPENLSASLSLKSLFSSERIRTEGSYSPENGMAELFEKGLVFLNSNLKSKTSFQLHLNSVRDIEHLDTEIVVDTRPDFKNVNYLDVTSVTLFFHEALRPKIQGFGCLFAKSKRILGVLFNSDIFSHRSKEGLFSETWILSGESKSEKDTLDEILKFRDQKFRVSGSPVFFQITSWKNAIPNYNLQHEYFLYYTFKEQLTEDKKHIIKLGNYTGDIGLNKILEKAVRFSRTCAHL